jgi:hypothetical protein
MKIETLLQKSKACLATNSLNTDLASRITLSIKCLHLALKLPLTVEQQIMVYYDLSLRYFTYTSNMNLAEFYLKKASNILLKTTLTDWTCRIHDLQTRIYEENNNLKLCKNLLVEALNESSTISKTWNHYFMHRKMQVLIKMDDWDGFINFSNMCIEKISGAYETVFLFNF